MTHSDRYGRRGSERRDRGRDRERYDDCPVKRRRRGGGAVDYKALNEQLEKERAGNGGES